MTESVEILPAAGFRFTLFYVSRKGLMSDELLWSFVDRMKRCRVPPLASRTRLLLEKLRARQRRWARRSVAS